MGALIQFFVVGLLVLVAAVVALSLVGTMISGLFGVAAFLLFKVAPILLVGWLVVKLLERRRDRRGLSAADRDWLDGRS